MRYAELVDGLLAGFDGGYSQEQLVHACQLFLYENGEGASPLLCVDYIMAAVDYFRFVFLIQDHRELHELHVV